MTFFAKTRMFKAIRKNDIDTVRKLLEDGYWIYRETEFSNTNAPMLAVREDRREILDLLFQYKLDYTRPYGYWNSKTLLHVACELGRKEIVEKILKMDEWNKTLPTLTDDQRETAMHTAARAGHKDIFMLLMDAGFDPHFKSVGKKSAVGIAHEFGHHHIVALVQEVPLLPAPAVLTPEEPQETPRAISGWVLLSPERAAFVSKDVAIGYKLTEIFNFTLRERVSLSANLDTGAELRERVSFDDHADKTPLEFAHAAYANLGGKIAKDVIYSPDLGKPKPAANL